MCVCRGSPISGSFPTLLPSAFLILVELRPEAYSSPVQHCQKNLCMCQGLGVRGQLQPLGIDCFYCGLWPVLSLSVVVKRQQAGSARVLGDTAGFILGPKGEAKHHVLCCLLGPQRCLHWCGGGAWAGELLGWLKGPGLLEPKWGPLRLGGGHLLLLSLG